MLKAVMFAKLNCDGKLHRHPGGYWSHLKFRTTETQYPWWGTPTVEALVNRGVAKYTAFQKGRNGEFPTEATII